MLWRWRQRFRGALTNRRANEQLVEDGATAPQTGHRYYTLYHATCTCVEYTQVGNG